jgi:hypothetical protein
MRSQRVLLALLAVIAVGVAVIAVVLVLDRTEKTHTDAWRKAREEARSFAEDFCSNTGAADPASYGDCVDKMMSGAVIKWEDEHPDQVWR